MNEHAPPCRQCGAPYPLHYRHCGNFVPEPEAPVAGIALVLLFVLFIGAVLIEVV